jgi:hypothetical protein
VTEVSTHEIPGGENPKTEQHLKKLLFFFCFKLSVEYGAKETLQVVQIVRNVLLLMLRALRLQSTRGMRILWPISPNRFLMNMTNSKGTAKIHTLSKSKKLDSRVSAHIIVKIRRELLFGKMLAIRSWLVSTHVFFSISI